MCHNNRICIRVLLVDILVQPNRAARILTGFLLSVLDSYQIAFRQISSVHVIWCYNKIVPVNPLRESALCTGKQALLVGTLDHLAHMRARLTFCTGIIFGDKFIHLRIVFRLGNLHISVRQRFRRADTKSVDLQTGTEFECLERHESPEQIGASDHYAVVGHHDGVHALVELIGDLFSQRGAARQVIPRHTNLAANHVCVGDQVCVWDLTNKTERNQRRRMRVQNRLDIRPPLIKSGMERQFRRRLVAADHRAVRLYAHNIVSC